MRPAPSDVRPTAAVFVDQSGRRRRTVKRLGIVAALLGAGYGATLVVIATTGVPIDAPGLPQIERPLGLGVPATHARRAPADASTPQRAGTTPRVADDLRPAAPSPVAAVATTPATPYPTARSTPGAVPSSAASSTTPGTLPATTAPTTAAATRAASSNGQAATAPGATNRPTTQPSPRGRSSTAPGATHRTAKP